MLTTAQFIRKPATRSFSERSGLAATSRSAGGRRKANGIHYTPPRLAAYLAGSVVGALKESPREVRELSVLDPACGEGELLNAVVGAVPRAWRPRLHLTGFDTDEGAVAAARRLLEGSGVASVELHTADFLSQAASAHAVAQMDFFQSCARDSERRFDVVVSNPPYVRTQVLGSAAARELAARFDLAGRVDLSYAFVKAMTLMLREGGTLGLLTSNRFFTVQSGSSVRQWLAHQFKLRRVVDLGDTKLFDAAVLPAIIVAERTTASLTQGCEFIRVYASSGSEAREASEVSSVLDALDGAFTGFVRANGLCFRVEAGTLQVAEDTRTPWAMSSASVDKWLATAKSHSACTFADVAKICVGIKTTADAIFIRNDWEALPEMERPEDELLHPLVTHHVARRWQVPADVPARRVLYPYVREATTRKVVDLDKFPRARAYLQKHRSQLERRSYVVESGRRWYEVWVPHRPAEWTTPKLAFPDISEASRFFFVEPGWIVNGDCYWTKLLPGKDASWLMLMLAVANSSFALKFYDTVFHNKLYSGRRRFMSQYVSRFPLPKLGRARDILDLIPTVVGAARAGDSQEVQRLEALVDELVWKSFGLAARRT